MPSCKCWQRVERCSAPADLSTALPGRQLSKQGASRVAPQQLVPRMLQLCTTHSLHTFDSISAETQACIYRMVLPHKSKSKCKHESME